VRTSRSRTRESDGETSWNDEGRALMSRHPPRTGTAQEVNSLTVVWTGNENPLQSRDLSDNYVGILRRSSARMQKTWP
jgi:hypothetical protein